MTDDMLVAEARKHLGVFCLRTASLSAGSVAAALLTDSGSIYTGICMDLACGIGFCAEHATVADMLKNRETAIRKVVAVDADGTLPPCGRCRELMIQVDGRNFTCEVILADGNRPLGELLPHYWNA